MKTLDLTYLISHCVSLQVNEIYHDQSLGAKINVVLVRIIMLGSGKVRFPPEKTVAVTLPSCKKKERTETGTSSRINKHRNTSPPPPPSPCTHQHARMPGACYSSGLSKRGTKSMQRPRGVFPSRTPSQFSTEAHRKLSPVMQSSSSQWAAAQDHGKSRKR